MKPVAKFDGIFDIVKVDEKLFAITSYGSTYAYAFRVLDENTRAPEPNEYRLFPKTADGGRMSDFSLSDVDHFTVRCRTDREFRIHRAQTSADWLFK